MRVTITGAYVLPELLEIAMPRTRRPYPSDLSDEKWALLEPLLASSERRGRPPKWPARRVANAVFCLLRSGCAWRMLPSSFPPWPTVFAHFRRWRPDRDPRSCTYAQLDQPVTFALGDIVPGL